MISNLNLKTLIIRTDRLGDFYQTIPYINCLTRTYGKRNVDIVVKKHIYSHIKKKKYLYNNLYPFNEKGIFSKIQLILKLRKNNYNQIIIFIAIFDPVLIILSNIEYGPSFVAPFS